MTNPSPPPHHHRHPAGLSWSYRKEVAIARARSLMLRVGRVPERVLSAIRNRFGKTSPGPAAAPSLPPAGGVFGKTIPSPASVHDPRDSERCCAHAVATAMEARIVGGQMQNAVVISAEDIYRKFPARELGAATEAAAAGVLDDQQQTRTAKVQYVNAGGSDEKCQRMRALIDQNVPLAARLKVYDNFETFSGTGLYARGTPASVADHAVCILGYGITGQGEVYWLCKNSYGQGWGDSGNVRVRWQDPDVVPEISVYAITQVTP